MRRRVSLAVRLAGLPARPEEFAPTVDAARRLALKSFRSRFQSNACEAWRWRHPSCAH